MKAAAWLLIVVLVHAGPVEVAAQVAGRPEPPMQRPAGPGGMDYAHTHITTTHYREASGNRYWVFEPADALRANPLPVVVYVHGLNASNYGSSWLWIRHLVRKGNLVIYPQYQRGVWLNPKDFTADTAATITDALKRLDGKRHPQADTARFALVGHSLGGTIAANLAADAAGYGLPRPGAVMAVQPGDVKTAEGLGAFLPSLLEDYSTIPRGTLMLVIATQGDTVVGQQTAIDLFNASTRVLDEDKDFILIDDDRHGRPVLYDGHLMAWSYIDRLGQARQDAYDFALWRWLDALTDAAFYEGRHREIALGNTPEQRDMGKWSDGTPVREPTITDSP